MIVRIAGIGLILLGIAGLILPVLPGIALIAAGLFLLFPRHNVRIDWRWVEDEVKRSERIKSSSQGELADCLRMARGLARPAFVYSLYKPVLREDCVEIDSAHRFTTRRIALYIKDAERLIVFLATIGSALEKKASELMAGSETLKGYLLDRIGSYAVESLARSLVKKFRSEYRVKGKSVSQAFSPGYCDWPIEDQRVMAALLDFSRAGVTLTESLMMIPKKSISSIAAVAGAGVFKDNESSCDICGLKNCGYRRVA